MCIRDSARPVMPDTSDYSVSILVPARNEAGNIENAILRTPAFGNKQEFIFVEGHSKDNTWEEIQRVKAKYPEKNIVALRQTGKGKGNAVREGFDVATGDVYKRQLIQFLCAFRDTVSFRILLPFRLILTIPVNPLVASMSRTAVSAALWLSTLFCTI